MPGLVRYANAKGVDVMLWARWTDLETQEQRDELLPRWKSWGVAGVKLDFMDSDTQARLEWYEAAMADTAEHELMVNFHGATLPYVYLREWPHVLTSEGVRGAEYYKFGEIGQRRGPRRRRRCRRRRRHRPRSSGRRLTAH